MKKLLIGLSFLSLTLNAFALTPQRIYQDSVTAVLNLKYYKNGRKPGPVGGPGSSHATGFFIGNEGILVTNNHVVENTNLKTMVGISFKENRYFNFTELYRNKKTDIAILKVDRIQKNDTSLELADAGEKLTVGDDSYWIGHPGGLKDFTFSRGYVGKFDNNGDTYDLQLHGVGFHGSSGSPFLNEDGKVIGILATGSNKNEIISLASPEGGEMVDFAQEQEYEEIQIGSNKESISKALEKAKAYLSSNPNAVNLGYTKDSLSEIPVETIKSIESKNDLASLIRELKAYTPPEERKLGSL